MAQTYSESVDYKNAFIHSPEFVLFLSAFLASMRRWLEDRPVKYADNSRIETMANRVSAEIYEVLEMVEIMESARVFNVIVLEKIIEEIIDSLFISIGLVTTNELKINLERIVANVDGYGAKSGVFESALQAAGDISNMAKKENIQREIENLIIIIISMWKHLPVSVDLKPHTEAVFRKNNINHLAIYNQGFDPESGEPLDEADKILFAEHVYDCLRILRKVPGFGKHPLFHYLFIEQILDFRNSERSLLQIEAGILKMTPEQRLAALEQVENGGNLLVSPRFRAWKKWYDSRAKDDPIITAADTMKVAEYEKISLMSETSVETH